MTNCSSIWIGNLSFGTKVEDLRLFFGDLSQEITEIELPEYKDEDGFMKNKGFAVIAFDSNDAAKRALLFNEAKLKGRSLLIKMQNDYRRNDKKTGKVTPSSTIFLGNLGFDVVREDLITIAKPFGHLAGVRLGTFQDTGRCKGFGYLDFEDVQSARLALNSLQQSLVSLKGRKVHMEFASEQAAKRGKPWLENPQKPKRQVKSVEES